MQQPVTVDGLFHPGDPLTGTKGTPVSTAVLNAILMEIVNVILAAGIALDPTSQSQLLAAINIYPDLNGTAKRCRVQARCTGADASGADVWQLEVTTV